VTLSVVAMTVVRAGVLVCAQSWYPTTLAKLADQMAKSPIRNSGSLFFITVISNPDFLKTISHRAFNFRRRRSVNTAFQIEQ